jgi:glycine hydroxymethyltransferase
MAAAATGSDLNNNNDTDKSSEEFSWRKVPATPEEMAKRDLYENFAIATDYGVRTAIRKEHWRHIQKISLVPGENFPNAPVLRKMMTWRPVPDHFLLLPDKNKKAQKKRDPALEPFDLDPKLWGVQLLSYSESPERFRVLSDLIEPRGLALAFDLPNMPDESVVTAEQILRPMRYVINPETGLIDYEAIQRLVQNLKPKVLVVGASSYPRGLDYKRFREMADENAAYLMADISHLSALVAAKALPGPFEFADIVTTTTHQSLRGPRACAIYYRTGVRSLGPRRKRIMFELGEKIDEAVGSRKLLEPPSWKTLAEMVTAFEEAKTEDFRAYGKQVIKNAQAMCNLFIKVGYKVATGGTDNHLCLVDLRGGLRKIDVALVREKMAATGVLFDMMILEPSSADDEDDDDIDTGFLVLGTSAITARNFKEEDCHRLAIDIHEGIETLRGFQVVKNATTPIDFADCPGCQKKPGFYEKDTGCSIHAFNRWNLEHLEDLRCDVEDNFAEKFPLRTFEWPARFRLSG